MTTPRSLFLFGSRRMDDAAHHILQLTKQYIGLNTLFIAWNDGHTNTILKAINRAQALVEEGQQLPFELSYCNLVIQNGNRPLFIPDTTKAPETASLGVTQQLGRCTFVGVPILMAEVGACATICGLDLEPCALTERETDFLMTMAQLFSHMLELEHSVYRDSLTELHNRKYLQELFEQEIVRSGEPCLLLFLDLDGFKSVNDRYGHESGDLLLAGVARRLEQCLNEGDVAIRLGGDEFVLVLRNSETIAVPAEIAKQVLEAVSAVDEIDGRPVALTASIGISSYPAHGKYWQDLLQRADEAMYKAKADGRNRFRFYTKA